MGLRMLYRLAGLVQATFTIGVLLLFIPIYHSFYLSLVWQVRPASLLNSAPYRPCMRAKKC